ncbi:PAS domain S-box-containing protein [Paenibacillus catalpae]|uniref:histidine kinase n=1 Tax=Paenibacillus catalpae TaxID=1045775 RepID=A0A1I1V1U2_9BACL|nr:ATP-binding protein [Paenibacillus catalpae]SFD75043.1 PAS domain S-box-containing protein [Paenibacillus catalpae]
MFLFDYIVNLSIFSLLVSAPLVIRSFINLRPLKHPLIWSGLYAGVVSFILVLLAVKQQGYVYDIRYAPVILMFAYLGPVPGLITGLFALSIRLLTSGNWFPAIGGWAFIMVIFSLLHVYFSRRQLPLFKRSLALSGAYIVLYMCIVFTFRILVNEPLFHLQYLLFVLLGVLLGGLLIESHERLRRTIAERNEMELSLSTSEYQYRLIAENTSDLIVVMDPDHSVRYFSPSHAFVLGYPDMVKDRKELDRIISPDDMTVFNQTVRKILEQKTSRSMEIRFRHQDGRLIPFDSLCKPVEGKGGRIEHIVIISRDISERKKAEEFLLQSEKLSIVGELAAGVAHEIRNPLTTIKGFLQLYKLENPRIKYGDLLQDELERIEIITSELLSMAKPQATAYTLTNVKDVIEQTLEFLTPQSLLNNIEFKRDYHGEYFPVACVKNQIKQVFLNILKNAIESMPGGGEIQISLQLEASGECLISIQDQGCGIPEEHLHRLGQPFYSLKEKGTGLGLMISHKIIKQYHGQIVYQSKVGVGTRIEIRLPISGIENLN